MDTITLNNGNKMPKMLIGSFQVKGQENMDEIMEAAVAAGAFGFDTAPSYRTEEILTNSVNKALKNHKELKRSDFFVQTKLDSWQMIARKGDIRPFITGTLKKCHMDYWDLLLIHWPQPEYYTQTWLSMEKACEEGLVKNIGVCNFSVRHFKELERAGAHMLPQVAQNEIHPFNTEPELAAYCRKNHIALQAYSPLCRMIPEIRYNALLNILAQKYGVSVAQIILRWHIEMGFVPIAKSSGAKRIAENTDVFSFALTKEDRDNISRLNQHFKIFLESRCCPGY